MEDLTGLVAVMAPFLMVFGIVWVRSRSKLEEKRLHATAESSAEKAAQYVSHVAELEDRVRVLERIVTDRGYDVATQIEALRDQRRVESSDNGVAIDNIRRERV
ncbi:hypothetical protein GCM10011515_20520 [Tsuneonella deserti]|uniref:Phage shock protein B n=1 Tax=Tsuneonella deserti TaxID=2035528 RepID=A0ABQ1S9G4_9SPHN|nr:hypothetical protein [Tsuneonella deserti]GGE00626.1 hypothetical protein GCM10011515_20520 [Tsuneonella deserti]